MPLQKDHCPETTTPPSTERPLPRGAQMPAARARPSPNSASRLAGGRYATSNVLVMPIATHQPVDALPRPILLQRTDQGLLERPLVRDGTLDDVLEQRALVAEDEVDRLNGHARPVGDLLQARRPVALRDEQLPRRLDDLLAGAA